MAVDSLWDLGNSWQFKHQPIGNARRQFGDPLSFLLGRDGVIAIWLKEVFSVSGRELRYTNLRMPPSGD
jgi:hypothetical protein